MLHFEPHLTVITSLDHDHVDTYPSAEEYRSAFIKFLEQSDFSLLWEKDLRYLRADPAADLEAYDELMDLSYLTLAGDHVRHNAFLVQRSLSRLFPDIENQKIVDALNSFPGTERRFEKLADNLYSDYGHHPVEIAATLQLARELSNDVVLVYQPHQNIRQHEIKREYANATTLASKVYWLPTYLSREDPQLEVLTPEQLTEDIQNKDTLHFADLDDQLWSDIQASRMSGALVLCMGAGSIDGWLREQLTFQA